MQQLASCLSRTVKRLSAAGVTHVVVIVLGMSLMTFVVDLTIDICNMLDWENLGPFQGSRGLAHGG